jgi:glycosyltransferase involved in cell wall biosynthesis
MTHTIADTVRERENLADRRVAVLTEMDEWSSSTRYRASQYVPALRARFHTVELLTSGDTVERRPGRVGQMRFFAEHGVRYGRRLLEVRREVRAYDALFIQRGLYVPGPGAIVAPVERFGGRVVFDLDDAVFELPPLFAGKGPAARWLWGPHQARRLLRRADAIVVSTPALAEMLPKGSVDPVVLPTVPDPARYSVVGHGEERPVVIGWTGTVGSIRSLDPLEPVFERLAHENLARLEVVSSQPWRPHAAFRQWRVEDATTLFADFAIGIMPLADTPYTRAKAGFKLLQYMAAGLPVVASPVGVNSELVRRSGAGYLAQGNDEWESALRELSRDAELRRELGRRGRAFVERFADLEGHARTLARLLAGERPS